MNDVSAELLRLQLPAMSSSEQMSNSEQKKHADVGAIAGNGCNYSNRNHCCSVCSN